MSHDSPMQCAAAKPQMQGTCPRCSSTLACSCQHQRLIVDLEPLGCRLQVRLQLQSFGFTKGKATQVPTYKGTPLHVLATIVRNEGITGPFKVLRTPCSAILQLLCEYTAAARAMIVFSSRAFNVICCIQISAYS